ncbi:TPA: fimbrial protein [Salmonella enterica subsp. enterica serovar Enteritidis]|uniref:fimbrial protein n=1 Tax=Salmonella enterica TaxID=28901 RepID=UPI0002A6CCC7|nr:fimbrial protein [Salmonella enterica]ECF1699761.1 fimbrial protein SteF [Salmonella enterica subsp. enterica]ECG5954992.1 fimbrial protein SteF [Salmonella enterica subsp. enterica serovar Baguida]EDU6361336.1 fimbrial protein [Salmonella enterica subsp. enterica serovar Florian]EGX8051641.1 fimbrial protein [Salmonella enterica subsp. enterica serovar Inganda]ELO83543.1 fimbrial protein SteF [Salmonella enterica subsp. enterica serovar Enteritidis str. SARB17]
MKLWRRTLLHVIGSALSLTFYSQSIFAGTAIHYSGELIAGACEMIVNGDTMATVDFNTVSISEFNANEKTTPVPFTLSLKNCHTALATGVLVTFHGVQDSFWPNLLALESSSTADGFAIGIETTDHQPLMINATQGTEFLLTDGNTTISLEAWLQKHSGTDITPGEFTGSATVSFEYQ